MWYLLVAICAFAAGWIVHDFWTWLICRVDRDENI